MARRLLVLAVAAPLIAACDAGRPTSALTPSPASTLQAGDPYFAAAQETLADRLARRPVPGPAKNVILFVADGMDPTTVTAARIYDGQSRGESGEENVLAFETFPHVALAKTYTHDFQVADSAGTMSAMVTGVKTNSGVLSVTKEVRRNDCEAARANAATTLGELADRAGLSFGIVSSARVTHATPAAVYAHSANRDWEDDTQLPTGVACPDIARQLIEFDGDIDLVMGGGRRHFLPQEAADPEDEGETGARGDGRDLTAEWAAKSDAHVFVWDKAGFDALEPGAKPLALFERSHMEYEADREEDAGGEPSLEEMTAKAIEMLRGDENGFFLVVEAGRVDHAHHGGNAERALRDAQEFAQAIGRARAMTDAADTLIVATADHGHTLAIQGYPVRGENILGVVKTPIGEARNAADGTPYTTLAYANGPGAIAGEATRPNPLEDPTFGTKDYKQQSAIPSYSESHGGQDVAVYASGPEAHLFSGVVEQNYIYHVIDHALRLSSKVEAAGGAPESE